MTDREQAARLRKEAAVDDKRIIDMTVGELRAVVRALLREEVAEVERAPKYATIDEAAEHFRVTTRTVRNWIGRGAPVRRLGGGTYRIELDAMAEWQAGESKPLRSVK